MYRPDSRGSAAWEGAEEAVRLLKGSGQAGPQGDAEAHGHGRAPRGREWGARGCTGGRKRWGAVSDTHMPQAPQSRLLARARASVTLPSLPQTTKEPSTRCPHLPLAATQPSCCQERAFQGRQCFPDSGE